MSDKVELTELDEAAYGNQAAEFELHSMRLQIAELQVSLAVSQREAADWKQELEAYKATENARISELQADLAQARAEAKTNGDEAAAVRRLYGDAMVGIGELQAEAATLRNTLDDAMRRVGELQAERDALMSCKEAASDEQIVDPQELVDRANCYEADHEFIDGHLLKLGAQEIRRLEAKVLALQSWRESTRTAALEEAANYFDGTLGYNFIAADGYANAFDIASELRFMATQSQPQPLEHKRVWTGPGHLEETGYIDPAPLGGSES